MDRILVGTTRHNSVNLDKGNIRHSGESIIQQGDHRDILYKVMQGTVSLYMNYGTENEYLLGVYTTGKCFGVYNCYADRPSPYSAIADEDTVIMEIPKDELHSYLALNPKNAEEALISLSNQISLAMKRIEMINEELMKKQ